MGADMGAEGLERDPVESDPANLERRIQSLEIVDIARQDHLSQASRAERHVRVCDVVRAGASEQQAHEPSFFVIERDDVHVRQAQECGDPRLTRGIAPGLSHARGGHRDPMVAPARLRDEDCHRAIAALERNQRAGIEDDAGHAAPRRSLRAWARSAAEGGPPVLARLSASRTSKSASAASWAATACSM